MSNESVFIAIFCEDSFYRNYDYLTEDKRNFIIPLVLMLNRWDGKIGFIGGNIDEGESHLQCIIRELKEEIGYDLLNESQEKVKFVCSHKENSQATHLYALSVNEKEFRDILKGQHDAIHYLAEGTCSAIHFINYPHNNSFDNFMLNNFAPTVKNEIKELVKFLNWSKKYNLPY